MILDERANGSLTEFNPTMHIFLKKIFLVQMQLESLLNPMK